MATVGATPLTAASDGVFLCVNGDGALAGYFGLPERAFGLTQGAGARRKRFKIEGRPAELHAAMKARLP